MQSIQELLNTDVEILLTGGRLSHKQIALLCAQLTIPLQAGLSPTAALALAARSQTDRTVRQLLTDVAAAVQEGQSLSKAFHSRKDQLPDAFLAAIRSGEASGELGDAFRRMQVYYEHSAASMAKVRSALAYPALLGLVAICVVALILLYAVPVFEKSFANFGTQLPLPTRILIGLSHFFSSHILSLTAGFAAGCTGLLLFCKTQPGQRITAFLALHLPGLRSVKQMQAAAQFSDTLHALLSAGLSLPEALRAAASVVDNALIREEIFAACQGLLEGRTLAQGLQKSQYLPKLLTDMASVGEQTGKLEQTLQVVSDYYTRELESSVKTALSLLEPCLTLVLALVVVFILLAVYLPLFSMYGFV